MEIFAGFPIMPILKKEPDMYPENLLEDWAETRTDANWYAFYTMSRHEKELMRRLRAQKISHYGPTIQQRKRSPQGRIRTSHVPLFAGYVFVFGNTIERYDAIATGCVSRCIEVKEHSQLLVDLRKISKLITYGTDVQQEPKPIVGRRAVIKRGAMAGLSGVVTLSDSRHRLTVLVHFMQQGASVVIDETDVDLV